MLKRGALALVGLGLLGAAGCSTEDEAPTVGVVESTSTEASSRTIAFMQEHKASFKMRAPSEELVGIKTLKDDLKMTHVRLRQVERGVRVIGGNAVVHYDPAGGISDLHQDYIADLDRLDVAPKLDAATLKTLLATGEESISEPELVIYAFDHHAPTLSWEMKVRTADRRSWIVTYDAHTGDVVSRIPMQHTAKGSGVGVLGAKRDLEVTSSGGKFSMIDSSREFTLTTKDAKQNPDTTKATVITGTSATSFDTTSALGKGSAVDAQANIALVVDYYSKNFARKSWDNKNGDVPIIVHVGDSFDNKPGMDNAYFDQEQLLMAFGDGRELLKPTAGFLDITAHEFTHAVTFYSSNLRYENQSGALNEGISDIFAALIEHSIKPNEEDNWCMGEGSMLDGTRCMRNLKDPAKGFDPQPGHMNEFVRTTEDEGGVHTNSGIPNKAAQLMTVGGTNTTSKINVARGLGWEKSEQLWYRTNTMYLTETSDFAAAAKATMTAAKDLKFTQDEQNIVDCSWKAVGVVKGTCAKISSASTGDDDDSAEDRSDDDDDSSDDDDDDKPKKKSTKKKSTGAATTGGCSTTATGTGGNWMWILAAGALVLGYRRRNGRA